MHSRTVSKAIMIILGVTIFANIFFCLTSIYYISHCNGVVIRTIEGTDFIYAGPKLQDNVIRTQKPIYSELNWPLMKETVSTRSHTRCPEIPPNLEGNLGLPQIVFNTNLAETVHPGGLFTPECVHRESSAIIIPYRERQQQLQVLLYHLHTVLQRQQLQYVIFVVEMAYPTQFNRGLLANVGFLTARSMLNFTCYIIHDVDIVPTNDRNLYRCSDNPRHLSVSNSKYGYELPYEHYIGGVIALTHRQFININGFSNAYFGWGKEDDDLYKRLLNYGYEIERPDPSIGVYEEIATKGIQDISNPDNPMKDGLYVHAAKRFRKDGVKKMLYNRLALEFRPLYTWVYVNTSELSVMQMIRAIDPSVREIFAKYGHL